MALDKRARANGNYGKISENLTWVKTILKNLNHEKFIYPKSVLDLAHPRGYDSDCIKIKLFFRN